MHAIAARGEGRGEPVRRSQNEGDVLRDSAGGLCCDAARAVDGDRVGDQAGKVCIDATSGRLHIGRNARIGSLGSEWICTLWRTSRSESDSLLWKGKEG